MLDLKLFREIPVEYRSKPFWSINDTLEEEKIYAQIDMMAKQGMGGFFIHPRAGMTDTYLYETYMAFLQRIIAYGAEKGLEIWLYDEDRFPSGVCGGKVTEKNPEYGALEIEMVPLDRDNYNPGRVMATYTGDEGMTYAFFMMNSEGMERFDGQPYVDVGNQEAIEYFIQLTHEHYKSYFEDAFSNTIKGIFTDEPSYIGKNSKNGRRRIPYTKGLEQEFMTAYGDDLKKHIYQLFFDKEDYQAVRFHYWKIMTKRFAFAYNKTIHEWCQKNGLAYTGHFWEHVFPSPFFSGAVMPSYAYMDIPGVDILFDYSRGNRDHQVGYDFIVKEAVSIANQLGKKRVISETYGASGWELDFKSQKRTADWLLASGVNFMCQHLVHYSLRGFRKRDFPPSFSDHQPWWDNYHYLADYIGRLSYVLSQGKAIGDILVIHPAVTTWTIYTDAIAMENVKKSIDRLIHILNGLNYPYDLGDEVILEQFGSVEGDHLYVGEGQYRTIILPDISCISSNTFKLLQQFSLNGGLVLYIGQGPEQVEGTMNQALQSFLEHQAIPCESTTDAIGALLSARENERILLEALNRQDLSDIYVNKRRDGDDAIYFISNFNTDNAYTLKLSIQAGRKIYRLDSFKGTCYEVVVENDEIENAIIFILQPYESILLLEKASDIQMPMDDTYHCIEHFLLEPAKIELSHQNTLTLKRCCYKINDMDWTEEIDVLLADENITNALGQHKKHIMALQPYMYKSNHKARLSVRYRFLTESQFMPNKQIFCAIEPRGVKSVKINGKKAISIQGYYVEKGFSLYDITKNLVPGENWIEMDMPEYDNHCQIESIYIVGSFKLTMKKDQFFIDYKSDLKLGNLVFQGYPYYNGAVKYQYFLEDNRTSKREKLKLGVNHFDGAVIEVRIDDAEAGIILSDFDRLDITPFLTEKPYYQLELILKGTLQNLLGWHNHYETPGIAKPESYYLDKGDYRFAKIGISGPVIVEIHGNDDC